MEVTVPRNYQPRAYQLPILQAIDDGFRRVVWVAHRRSGKDKTCVNLVAKMMIERIGVYYYVFPTYNQGRKILWDGIDKDGKRFLDHFPERLIAKKNDSEMKIWFKNGSLFQVVGSDNIDSIVGTNPVGVVFSEYALQDPSAWAFVRPILAENEGWAVFVSTVRGENHFYDLYELAKNDPTWYSQLDKASETKVIPQSVLDQERKEIVRLYGNDAFYQQEFECNFTVPIPGAYYADQIGVAYADGRVGRVAHEPRITVDTWWDLGINDRMAIWFTQSVGQEIRLIDYYENSGHGMDHYAQKLQEKRYVYGTHHGPHDIGVRELISGKTRKESAAALGIDFDVVPKIPVIDGIDAVRAIFSRCWFDGDKCRDGLNALKSYRKQYDEKRKTYLNQPYHDWSSNGADAFRMMAVGMDLDFKSSNIMKQRDKYYRNPRPMTFNPAVV
jgi:phage terminase large subunit